MRHDDLPAEDEAVPQPAERSAAPQEPATPVERPRVLVVDDDAGMRGTLLKMLRLHGYDTTVAATIAEARARLSETSFDAMLLDLVMPDESGMDFLPEVVSLAPHTAVIVLTGVQGLAVADEALQRGAHDFLRKPYSGETLLVAVQRCLRYRQLQLDSARKSEELRELLAERERLEAQLRARLPAPREMVFRVAELVAESAAVGGTVHLSRISRYCDTVARALSARYLRRSGAAEGFVERLGRAAYLHDIGHIALPESIAHKPGPLTGSEQLAMQRHTRLGAEVLLLMRDCCEPSTAPTLELAMQICRTHHERHDGTGYPDGLMGDKIPLSGRIAGLADLYDSTTSRRPYRTGRATHERAVEIISAERDRGFDGPVVDAFLVAESEIHAIADDLPDCGFGGSEANGARPFPAPGDPPPATGPAAREQAATA